MDDRFALESVHNGFYENSGTSEREKKKYTELTVIKLVQKTFGCLRS